MSEERRRLPAVEGLARIPAPPTGASASAATTMTVASPKAAPEPPAVRTATKMTRTPEKPDSRAQAPQAARGAGSVVMKSVSFSTPYWIRTTLRDTNRATAGSSIPACVLHAIEKHVDELDELVELEKRRTMTPPTDGALFPHAVGQDATNLAEPKATEVMRIAEGNLDVIDGLVKRCRAKDRSQLITAALRAEYTER